MANNSFHIDKSLSFRILATAPANPVLWEIYNDSTQNALLQWNGSTWSLFGSPATNNYYSGYFDDSAEWSTTSSTFVDPTVITAGTFTSLTNSGFGTVIRAASNLPGITFTPQSATAVYLVTATFASYGSLNAKGSIQMTDGTTVFSSMNFSALGNANTFPGSLTGIYIPGTGSSVTIKLQFAAPAGTIDINSEISGLSYSLMFTLVQIT